VIIKLLPSKDGVNVREEYGLALLLRSTSHNTSNSVPVLILDLKTLHASFWNPTEVPCEWAWSNQLEEDPCTAANKQPDLRIQVT